MRSLTKKLLFTALMVIFLFTACAPAQPTANPDDVANQVATSVALTVAAQNDIETHVAETVVAMATNTTLPTQTQAAPPTATPLPSITPVLLPTTAPSSGGGGGGGGTTVKPQYACNAINRRPFDNQIYRPNDEFDIKWTIVNTGTKTMNAGLDLKYSDGPKLTQTSAVELPKLEPGDEYVVDFDAVAPSKPGTYIMVFVVEGGLCFPYTAIVVEKQ